MAEICMSIDFEKKRRDKLLGQGLQRIGHHRTEKGVFMDIIKADSKTQEDWLLQVVPNETIGDLIVKAYSDAYGVYFLLDQSRLDDMLAYPSDYDLGETIRGRLTDLDDDRVEAIGNGATLTGSELAAVKECVLEVHTFPCQFTAQSYRRTNVRAIFRGALKPELFKKTPYYLTGCDK